MKNATFLWSFGNIQTHIQPHPPKIGLVHESLMARKRRRRRRRRVRV